MTRLKHFLCLLRLDSAETEELLLRLILFILGLYLLPLILSPGSRSSSSMLTCRSLRDCLPPVVAHLSDIIEGSSPPGSLRGPRSGSTSPFSLFNPRCSAWRWTRWASLQELFSFLEMLTRAGLPVYSVHLHLWPAVCSRDYWETHFFLFVISRTTCFFLMSSPTFNKAAMSKSITAAHFTDVVVRLRALSSFLLLIICYVAVLLAQGFYRSTHHLHNQTLLNICTEQQAAFKCRWEVCYCCFVVDSKT